ncbi:aspartyl/asparaginyl beta-hydroxylase domain-containing protein [Caulobacter mirabilis]|uniref:Aspartyl beta-hydroxylase n=1 Tax=Caulobacter mirabilis TaxID=69666 RepID=A0A2D2AYD7_9CAUL|nr:aspartyl/asparaginyl beta-hydroxylase domain-containing protein [Caulobacter mirabilis]ATQ43030.1 aspartyl beta-hydroxylase [Caulobacter mirabilis]
MQGRLKLPFRFDVARMRAEVGSLADGDWIPHYNARDYEGEWSGVALRSTGGRDGWLFPAPPGGEPYADTPTLGRLPYLAQVLGTFECPLETARLLRLHAGSSIREHVDHALGYEDGLARLHVPIVTSPEVVFYLDGAPVPMGEGECWYFDARRPHRVDNRGVEHRVHLVIDCIVDGWLAGVFAEAGFAPSVVDPTFVE